MKAKFKIDEKGTETYNQGQKLVKDVWHYSQVFFTSTSKKTAGKLLTKKPAQANILTDGEIVRHH